MATNGRRRSSLDRAPNTFTIPKLQLRGQLLGVVPPALRLQLSGIYLLVAAPCTTRKVHAPARAKPDPGQRSSSWCPAPSPFHPLSFHRPSAVPEMATTASPRCQWSSERCTVQIRCFKSEILWEGCIHSRWHIPHELQAAEPLPTLREHGFLTGRGTRGVDLIRALVRLGASTSGS
jgi:hypothetical protein